ncbi:MAG: hypothetical protein KKA42_14070 [candidate division Zixibacteria bacterium]|nr:hypothetical protein [candidate division Zixibacteria bacterium]
MNRDSTPPETAALADSQQTPALAKLRDTSGLTTGKRLGAILKYTHSDIETGRYRRLLYRFLTANIPLIHACIWTWVRLSAAPGRFLIDDSSCSPTVEAATKRLRDLEQNLYTNAHGNRVGMGTLLPDLFVSLYRDGIFGGFITVRPDASGVDRFLPLDSLLLGTESTSHGHRLILEQDNGRKVNLDRPDFYYIPFNSSTGNPFGSSILRAVPFVAYIEQQLVEDMRRSNHNAGYHRMHIKITPPERFSGEAEKAYTDRINGYFDSTVRMIKSCDVDDNPVTWDNVLIEHIGPDKSRDVTNSWFMSHRAMIEDVCAGTHLAPYLLGYSFGATTTWSGFKFDVVMRQVRSVQAEVSRFLEWLGNLDLAMAGLDVRCRFEFDNTFAYQARDKLDVESGRVDNILKLYNAGLIDEQTARDRAWQLL